jgi:hypothetical protein
LDTPETRELERSCTRFRTILEDDGLWKYSCIEYEDLTGGTVGASNREKAFVGKILGEINEEQLSCRENIILSVLPPHFIRRIINTYIVTLFNQGTPNPYFQNWPRSNMSFDVRGDSLRCLLDIVEAHMVQKLQIANLISLRAWVHGNGTYPEVILTDLQIVERSQGTIRFTGHIVSFEDGTRELLSRAIDRECGERSRYQLARRLSNRAGIVKMTSEVMREAVTDIFMVMASLLWRPMLIHRDILKHSTEKFDYDSIDLWNDIPPPIEFNKDGITGHSCVIVPAQIEESAAKLGIHMDSNHDAVGSEDQFKIYGRHLWALSVGQTLEAAIKTAKRRYMVKKKEEEAEESMSIDEYESLSDTSSDSNFSEYDDDECPDYGNHCFLEP